MGLEITYIIGSSLPTFVIFLLNMQVIRFQNVVFVIGSKHILCGCVFSS